VSSRCRDDAGSGYRMKFAGGELELSRNRFAPAADVEDSRLHRPRDNSTGNQPPAARLINLA
jgi:hypothetical protein